MREKMHRCSLEALGSNHPTNQPMTAPKLMSLARMLSSGAVDAQIALGPPRDSPHHTIARGLYCKTQIKRILRKPTSREHEDSQRQIQHGYRLSVSNSRWDESSILSGEGHWALQSKRVGVKDHFQRWIIFSDGSRYRYQRVNPGTLGDMNRKRKVDVDLIIFAESGASF